VEPRRRHARESNLKRFLSVTPRDYLRCKWKRGAQKIPAIDISLQCGSSQERDEFYDTFIHGKILVISDYHTELGDRFVWSAEVYDPKIGAWATLENMWTFGDGIDPQSCIVFLPETTGSDGIRFQRKRLAESGFSFRNPYNDFMLCSPV